jgi:thiol-disulfide isomerase/thioredoxin
MLWLYIGAALIGLALGGAFAWLGRSTPPEPGLEGAAIGDVRPGFRHGGLDGEWIDVDDFSGRPLLVNFWATWCAPCRREMPVLQEASERHGDGLAVIGLAIDDLVAVQDFVSELGIDYPIAVGNADVMATQRAWGNSAGALPYTVLVDRYGVIRWQHLGEVSADHLHDALEPWL